MPKIAEISRLVISYSRENWHTSALSIIIGVISPVYRSVGTSKSLLPHRHIHAKMQFHMHVAPRGRPLPHRQYQGRSSFVIDSNCFILLIRGTFE